MPTKRIVIIGAGVIGLFSALHCRRRGLDVTVIDRRPATRDGCSFGNAGMIVPSHFIPLAAPGMVALGLPAWLSSLIVTVVLFVAAGILVVLGKKKLQGVNFVPTESIEHIKTDIDTLKADVARARSR